MVFNNSWERLNKGGFAAINIIVLGKRHCFSLKHLLQK